MFDTVTIACIVCIGSSPANHFRLGRVDGLALGQRYCEMLKRRAPLEWFEVAIFPNVLHLTLRVGHPLTYMDRDHPNTIRVDAADLLRPVDRLVEKHSVFSTLPHHADRAFHEAHIGVLSLHIRMAYVNLAKWWAMYLPGEAPPNIQAFVRDCRALIERTVRQRDPAPITDEDTASLVETHIVRVKIARSGQITLNGVAVEMEPVLERLEAVASVGGILWFYRDDPDLEPTAYVYHLTEKVLKAAQRLNMRIRLCEEDFTQAG